jgi:Ca-activated chloride channel family protein
MNKILIALIMMLSVSNLWASTSGKVRSGNRYCKKGAYEKSLEKYREAQISAPDSTVVQYNIGNALYKTDQFDVATAEYQKALASKDRRLRSIAYYNLGNAAFKSEKTDEALDYYKKALDLNPNDLDAKYNIEYILSQKAQNQKNDKNKNSKDKKDQKQDKDKQQAAGAQGDQKDNKNKSGMSKEDAQRILQVYGEQDRESAKRRKMAMPQIPKTDEDW